MRVGGDRLCGDGAARRIDLPVREGHAGDLAAGRARRLFDQLDAHAAGRFRLFQYDGRIRLAGGLGGDRRGDARRARVPCPPPRNAFRAPAGSAGRHDRSRCGIPSERGAVARICAGRPALRRPDRAFLRRALFLYPPNRREAGGQRALFCGLLRVRRHSHLSADRVRAPVPSGISHGGRLCFRAADRAVFSRKRISSSRSLHQQRRDDRGVGDEQQFRRDARHVFARVAVSRL